MRILPKFSIINKPVGEDSQKILKIKWLSKEININLTKIKKIVDKISNLVIRILTLNSFSKSNLNLKTKNISSSIDTPATTKTAAQNPVSTTPVTESPVSSTRQDSITIFSKTKHIKDIAAHFQNKPPGEVALKKHNDNSGTYLAYYKEIDTNTIKHETLTPFGADEKYKIGSTGQVMTLGECHQFLKDKATQRSTQPDETAETLAPEVQTKRDRGQAFLEEYEQKAKKWKPVTKGLLNPTTVVTRLLMEHTNRSTDMGLGSENLVCLAARLYQNEQPSKDVVLFSNQLAGKFETDAISIPSYNILDGNVTEKSLKPLKDALKAFFLSRRKGPFATTIGTGNHELCFAIDSSGTFKIVDSMNTNEGTQTTRTNKVKRWLESLNLTDSEGKEVLFKGSYESTNLQVGGNQCIRFSELNAYWIAKTGNLDAHQQVTGAFLQGLLISFDDIDQISFASHQKKAVDETASTIQSKTLPFMHSWANRQIGIPTDRWQDLSLNALAKRIQLTQQIRGGESFVFGISQDHTIPIAAKYRFTLDHIKTKVSLTNVDNSSEMKMGDVLNGNKVFVYDQESKRCYIVKNHNIRSFLRSIRKD